MLLHHLSISKHIGPNVPYGYRDTKHASGQKQRIIGRTTRHCKEYISSCLIGAKLSFLLGPAHSAPLCPAESWTWTCCVSCLPDIRPKALCACQRQHMKARCELEFYWRKWRRWDCRLTAAALFSRNRPSDWNNRLRLVRFDHRGSAGDDDLSLFLSTIFELRDENSIRGHIPQLTSLLAGPEELHKSHVCPISLLNPQLEIELQQVVPTPVDFLKHFKKA